MSGLGWVDGALVEGVALPSGRGAFETLRAEAGELPLWQRHLARLAAAAPRLGVEFEPPAELRACARELLLRCGHEDDILRITLSVASGRSSWSLTSRPRPPSRPVRLHVVRTARDGDDPTAGFKSTEREVYDAALAAARAAGADDALLVDQRGRLLETATANVLVAIDGELCTPPLDGRIVPGVARALLLGGLEAMGRPAAERSIDETELPTVQGLWVTNAVHGPRSGVLHAGPTVASGALTDRLTEIWRAALERAET